MVTDIGIRIEEHIEGINSMLNNRRMYKKSSKLEDRIVEISQSEQLTEKKKEVKKKTRIV